MKKSDINFLLYKYFIFMLKLILERNKNKNRRMKTMNIILKNQNEDIVDISKIKGKKIIAFYPKASTAG